MFTLFPDQIQLQSDLLNEFKTHKRVIAVAPTGFGKMVVISDTTYKCLKKGNKTLLLFHRDELVQAAKEKLNFLGIFPHIITAGSKVNQDSICDVAMIQTFRKYAHLKKYNVVFIDEVHRGEFDNTIDTLISLFNPFIAAFTASPLRTGSQRCLSTLFQSMVEAPSIKELVGINRLTRARHFTIKRDFSKIPLKGGDFDTQAISEAFNKCEMYDGMIEQYREHSEGKKALVFNSNVENSKITCDKFREEGYECAHVDGNTPTWKRREILQDLAHKDGMIVTNCDILTTGFDEPSLLSILINRATLSLALYLQMMGRGSRIFPGKEYFDSIDMGSNVWRHMLWHSDRKWSLKKKPKGQSDGVVGIKICSACKVINSASARKCCECGAVLTNPVEKMLKNGEFMEITSDMERGVEAYFDKSKATLKELHKYAKQKGYSSGWAKVQYDIQQRKKEEQPFQRGVA